MSKKDTKTKNESKKKKLSTEKYEAEIYKLHTELVKLQYWVKETGHKVIVLQVRMRLDLGIEGLVRTMWGAAFGSGGDSAIHLHRPDHATVCRRQGGTGQLDLAAEVLLPIVGRQSLHAHFMPIKIQLRKSFSQTIQ